MESLRKLRTNNSGNTDMILTAVIAGVMFAVAIPIIYSVVGGIDLVSTDTALGGVYNSTSGQWESGPRPATNASNTLLTNLATFFTIGPIYLVVVAAVGIIAAILLLRAR